VEPLAVLHAQPRACLLDFAVPFTKLLPARPMLFTATLLLAPAPLFGFPLLPHSAVAIGVTWLFVLSVGSVLLLSRPMLLLTGALTFLSLLRLGSAVRLCSVLRFSALRALLHLRLGATPWLLCLLPRPFRPIARLRTVSMRPLQLTPRSGSTALAMITGTLISSARGASRSMRFAAWAGAARGVHSTAGSSCAATSLVRLRQS